ERPRVLAAPRLDEHVSPRAAAGASPLDRLRSPPREISGIIGNNILDSVAPNLLQLGHGKAERHSQDAPRSRTVFLRPRRVLAVRCRAPVVERCRLPSVRNRRSWAL